MTSFYVILRHSSFCFWCLFFISSYIFVMLIYVLLNFYTYAKHAMVDLKTKIFSLLLLFNCYPSAYQTFSNLFYLLKSLQKSNKRYFFIESKLFLISFFWHMKQYIAELTISENAQLFLFYSVPHFFIKKRKITSPFF